MALLPVLRCCLTTGVVTQNVLLSPVSRVPGRLATVEKLAMSPRRI